MKQWIIILVALGLALSACDDVIHPTLQTADPVYVVDAFINNKMEDQVIRLLYSQPYFEAQLPPGVSGATVTVTDNEGNVFSFIEDPQQKGSYVWTPAVDGFGKEGNEYTLSVNVKGEHFISRSRMGRVPPVDSITFERGGRNDGTNDFYTGQFWAADLPGIGDTYWIRTTKNGVLLNKPGEINLAYDAAFAKGSDFDGFTFIQPIRNGINPSDTDADDRLISPYLPGDSVFVEIYSLTEATLDYLNQIAIQTNRPGGFSELFATPLANVPTNLMNENTNGTRVQGFFNVGASSGRGKRFVK
jgi:Domain of unknown function (DUF4249)